MEVNEGNTSVVWIKTDAGRAEIQARALVKERAQRNLLLLIDGTKPASLLLSDLAGVSPADFKSLAALGLIAPAGRPTGAPAPAPAPAEAPADADPSPDAQFDYARFTMALTRLISKELGLRGFMLTLAVEKASTPEELRVVAQRTIDQIRERRGDPSADAARQTLYGG